MKKNMALTLDAPIQRAEPSRLKRIFVTSTVFVSRYLLAALFLYASYNKLIIYKRFVTQLNNSELLTDFHNFVPPLVKVIELGILVSGLYFKEYSRKALWASLGLLVLYAGYTYLFPNALSKPYLPNFLAWFVPSVEIITAVLLVLNKTRIIGLYSAFMTMVAFTAYVYVLPHFYHGGCSCGGIISTFTWKQHFWFNVGFTALAGLALCLLPPKSKQETV